MATRRCCPLGLFVDNEERFPLTGAAPSLGAPAGKLVRRAAKRKTLFIITCKRELQPML